MLFFIFWSKVDRHLECLKVGATVDFVYRWAPLTRLVSSWFP